MGVFGAESAIGSELAVDVKLLHPNIVELMLEHGTDEGTQFTSLAFASVLQRKEMPISMDRRNGPPLKSLYCH